MREKIKPFGHSVNKPFVKRRKKLKKKIERKNLLSLETFGDGGNNHWFH